MDILLRRKATVCKDASSLPSWCEVEHFEFLHIAKGGEIYISGHSEREFVFFVTGSGTHGEGHSAARYYANDVLEWIGGQCRIRAEQATQIVIVGGRWHEPSGSRGVFSLDSSRCPQNVGDPAAYVRNTDFDRHFHDCDEYWFITSGDATVVIGEESFQVSEGMCIVTPAGMHHDIPLVQEMIFGAYLETNLRGLARHGHLWNHTHGSATSS
jgi:mannose-6-phosphate isomerase-like protein (cupin superfamily)